METLKQTVDVELITKYSTRLQVRILPPELTFKTSNLQSMKKYDRTDLEVGFAIGVILGFVLWLFVTIY